MEAQSYLRQQRLLVIESNVTNTIEELYNTPITSFIDNIIDYYILTPIISFIYIIDYYMILISYSILGFFVICILVVFINTLYENTKKCYNCCRFHYNDKKGKLTGLIRRKIMEKRLQNNMIKLHMSPYVASTQHNYELPLKHFSLHTIKPIQTIRSEHIITIPTDYVNPR